MYDFIFQRSAKLQQRLIKEDISQTEEDTSQTTAFLSDYENDPLATQAVESPTSYDSDGGSGWNKMFGLPVGWLKRDREPKKDVSSQDPVVTDTEPTPEDEVATPVAENTDPVLETPTPAPEPDPIVIVEEPAPEPEDEVATPVAENTDPVLETPTPAPEPDPIVIVEEPAPEPEDEVATPVAENTDPVLETPTPAPEPTDSVSNPSEPADIDRLIAPTTLDDNGAISVGGGRVTTFVLPNAASITGVTVNTLPAYGNVTVNPDFTLALVLSGSDYAGPLSFGYTVTRSDGTTETQTATLDVTTPTQAAGWGLGNHYMLETDLDDKLVVEHGDNHRKVYISGSEDALTRADIAALEGVSESMITPTWLRNNPEYGGTEDMPLAADVGMELWYDMTASWEDPSSNWLLFERGYDYNDVGQIVTRGMTSESELHPVHITSYGEGPRPTLNTDIKIWQEQSDNIVFSDLFVSGGAGIYEGNNILMSHMGFSGGLVNVRFAENFTFRNSEITDSLGSQPLEGETWTSVAQGILVVGTNGILLEGNIFDHNGWQDDYLIDGSPEGGMAPNMYSQNVYLQYDTTDVTFRDNITSQGASHGAQLRGGGFVEGNLFLDNNVAFNVLGGNYKDFGFVGNYSLVFDNVSTSGGYKIAPRDGAPAWGVINQGLETTLFNNIVAHLANPDDPDEQAWKTLAQIATYDDAGGTVFFDDTIVLNWQGSEKSGSRAEDRNLGDVDVATAMATTIQRYAAEFLNVPLSQISDGTQMSGYYQSKLISDLMNYLLAERDADGGQMFMANEIIAYFQEGFNIAAEATGDTHHRFIPNDLGEGVRWDNRLNWTSDALPSDGDTVDLGGNWVNFSDTVKLNSFDLGTAGKLQVGSGKLTVDVLETGDKGMIFVERAGQVWLDGYVDDTPLSLQITGGRFANTDDVSGTVTASVQGGQMILAADDAQFTLGQDSKLRIDGTTAKVGFDGAEGGIATLVMQNGGQLSFVASAEGLGRVSEFRSGAWDQDGSNVRSGVVLDGSLALDLSDYIGTGSMKLMEVDAIAGMFDNLDIHGLDDNRDAQLVIDYAADLVTLELSSGTGQSSLSIRGDAFDGTDEDADLWDQLTAELDQSDDLDASITIFDDVIDALPEMTFI